MAASTINIECKRFGCVKNLLACYGNCRYTGRCDELRNELADKTAAAESDINRYLSERGRNPILVQIQKRGVKFGDRAERSSHKPAKPVKAVQSSVIAAKSRPPEKPLTTMASQPMSPPAQSKSKQSKPPLKTARNDQAARIKATSVRQRRSVIRPATPRPAKDRTFALPVSGAVPRIAGPPSSDAAPTRPRKSRLRKRSTMPRRAKPLARANVSASEGQATLTMSTPTIQTRPDVATRPSGERVAPRKKATAKSRKVAGAGKVYIIIEGQSATIVDEQGLMMHLFSNNSKTTRYFEASEVEARVQIVPKR